EQKAAARPNCKAARRLLGRKMPDRQQSSFFRVDAIAGKGAGPALAAVEKPAVRRHVQIGGGRLLPEISGQCVDKLQFLPCPRSEVDRISADRVRGLGDQVEEPTVWVEC